MTINQTGIPKLRLTNRGRWAATLAWLAIFVVGMVTAKYGVPGWDL